MKTHIKKVSKTLLFGLIVIAILVLIYSVIPKYQIHNVKVNDDYVLIIKINTLTGEHITNYERYSPRKSGESTKLKFTF